MVASAVYEICLYSISVKREQIKIKSFAFIFTQEDTLAIIKSDIVTNCAMFLLFMFLLLPHEAQRRAP